MEKSSGVTFLTEGSSVHESMGVQGNKGPFNTCFLENRLCPVATGFYKLLVKISTEQDLATKIQTKTLIAIIQTSESVTNRHLALSAKHRQTNRTLPCGHQNSLQ